MKTKKFTTVVAFLMMLVVLILPLSPVASAISDEKGSITLHLVNSVTNKPLANAPYRLYFIAKAYEDGKGIRYELNPPYDKANIDIGNLQDSLLPIHLMYFAKSHSLPYTEKRTNDKGVLVFDNLTPGLYLIVQSRNGAVGQTTMPFVVAVPVHSSQSGTLDFNINASPKILDGVGEDDGTRTYISVVKKWETDEEHPESVTAVLLKDFEVYAKVELNAGNNWHYRWDNLPKNHIWNVVEEIVPDGYTVSYDTSSNTVTIINKSDDSEEESTTEEGTTSEGGTPGGEKPEGTTGEGGTPGEGPTGEGGTQGEGTTKPSGSGNGEDNLVQTGQLNWPVPVCAIAGILIFSIGWAVLNFGKKESE